MNKEKDEKALKAFWCMLESAESKGRRVSYLYGSEINIWANKDEGRGVVASIRYEKCEEEEVVRWFLGMPVVKKYDKEDFIFGKVINPKDTETFHFEFSEEKVEPIKKRIKNIIEEAKNKEAEERDKSLESLIC